MGLADLRLGVVLDLRPPTQLVRLRRPLVELELEALRQDSQRRVILRGLLAPLYGAHEHGLGQVHRVDVVLAHGVLHRAHARAELTEGVPEDGGIGLALGGAGAGLLGLLHVKLHLELRKALPA